MGHNYNNLSPSLDLKVDMQVLKELLILIVEHYKHKWFCYTIIHHSDLGTRSLRCKKRRRCVIVCCAARDSVVVIMALITSHSRMMPRQQEEGRCRKRYRLDEVGGDKGGSVVGHSRWLRRGVNELQRGAKRLRRVGREVATCLSR